MVQKDTQFVMKNHKTVQPFIPTDGLELYYDVKGKKNTDNYKGTLLDMSGKGRHGVLSNFAYEGVSGFTGTTEGGLLLDDVDDKIVRPAISGVKYTSASRNLFDVSSWLNLTTSAVRGTITKDSSSITMTSTGSDAYTYTYGIDSFSFELTSGDSYNLSFKKLNNTSGTMYLFFYETKEQVTQTTMLASGGTNFAFTMPENTKYMKVRFGITTTGLTEKFYDIQLEKGSTATPYTPYIPLPVMTYQMNGNILSFEKDGTVKRTTKDANGNEVVVSRKGINLVRNGNFANGLNGWSFGTNIKDSYIKDGIISVQGVDSFKNTSSDHVRYNYIGEPETKSIFLLSAYVKGVSGRVYIGVPYDSSNYPISDDWSRIYYHGTFKTNTSMVPWLAITIVSQNRALIKNVEAVNLTEAYGAGNEPTLAYIQSHPEQFAWTPNPSDLIETVEIKNNLVGDLENLQGNDFEQHEDGVITYTNEAEEGSVVRVDIDGISDQPLRFRNATGEQVVITEHDQIDEDAIKKVEFQGNSVQLADKYREVSGTSVVIAPELHDKNVADKLVIGGNTTQYTESSNVVTDGLEMWLSGRNFSNSPATTTWKDLTGVNNGTASGFAFTTTSGSDGNGGVVFDGVDDTVNPVYSIKAPNRALSVEINAKVSTVSIYNNLISSNPPIFIRITDSGKVKYNLYYKKDSDSTNGWSMNFGTIDILPNITYNIHMTFDGNYLRGYVNGVKDVEVSCIGTVTQPINPKLGYTTGGESSPLAGTIYSARIYSRALTDAEVLQNYNAGLSIPIPNIAMPQEVKHVTSGSKVLVLGKNLRKESLAVYSNNSAYTVVEESQLNKYIGDKSWVFKTLNTNLHYVKLSDGMSFEQGKTYTCSYYFYDPQGYFNRSQYVDNLGAGSGEVVAKTDLGNGYFRASCTVTPSRTGVPTHGFLMYAYQGIHVTDGFVYISGIQIEEGTVPTTYDTYKQTETTIPVTLKSIG